REVLASGNPADADYSGAGIRKTLRQKAGIFMSNDGGRSPAQHRVFRGEGWVAVFMKRSSLAVSKSGPFPSESKLQRRSHGKAVDQGFARQQSGLARSGSLGQTAPGIHGGRQRYEGDQADV